MRARAAFDLPFGDGPPGPSSPAGWIGTAALVASLGGGGFVLMSMVTDRPSIALTLPALALGGVICARWPAAATFGLMLISGATGSLEAFFDLPTLTLRDFLLGGLWIGAIAIQLVRPERSPWLWPGLLGILLYIGLTAAEVFTAPSSTAALESFQVAVWPMTIVLLVPLAPWKPDTLLRMARGVIAVGLAVGAYAVYRKLAGPADDELRFASFNRPGLPVAELRFFSSFPTAQHLALFCATLIPFLAAVALVWRGPWRVATVAALPLLAYAVLASEVRTGLIAAAAGTAVTVLLFSLAVAYPSGRRVALATVGFALAILVGTGAYALTIAGDDESASRFENLLTPSEDPAFSEREEIWNRVLADAPEHPFGHGLGTVGGTRDPVSVDVWYTDSTFVKMAYEQGVVVMVLFSLALLTLSAGLAWRGVVNRQPGEAVFAIGAAGTLVAVVPFFYAGNYIDQLQMIAPWLIVGLGVAAAAPRPAARARAPQPP